MKVTPILMDGESMVALLAGRKTQTRRTRGLDRFNEDPSKWTLKEVRRLAGPCPYGEANDTLLYCKETWTKLHAMGLQYRADHKPGTSCWVDLGWKSSMFMPRLVSRVTLRLTGVEVERVQRLSVEDIFSEGCPVAWDDEECSDTRAWWHRRWDGINLKKYPYASNPFVRALEFEALLQNVDSVIEDMEAVK